jgi:lipoate synthase
LCYANVTGVALSDGGAWLYAVTVRAIKRLNPSTGVQQLIPLLQRRALPASDVFESRPEVLARNVETAGSQGKLQARAILGEVAWPKPWTEATHR